MKTAPVVSNESDLVLYSLYQSMPAGAVFLSPELNVLAANRKMRVCFPRLANYSQMQTICEAVRCPKFRIKTAQRPHSCEGCVLYRAVKDIICGNRPMRETQWRYAYYLGNRRFVRWFHVSGIPVPFSRERNAALFFSDVTEQVLKEKLLRKKLKLDPQTKFLNKVSLLRLLDALLRTKDRESFTVCMVDFDDFKSINDRYGHLMGDRVLNSFCRIARENIRSGDVLGRFGGEEFLYILKVDQRQAVLFFSGFRRNCGNRLPASCPSL